MPLHVAVRNSSLESAEVRQMTQESECCRHFGFHFMDEAGREVGYGAEGLAQVRSITTEKVMPELASCTFQIACDVTNPLVGAQGCSAVFAPQKGADAKMVQAMDVAMNRYADMWKTGVEIHRMQW